MARSKVRFALRIILILTGIIVIVAGSILFWLSRNYKQTIVKELPEMVAKATDSVYHISFTDVSINLKEGTATITGLKLWPDKNNVQKLRSQNRRVPTTLHTVSMSRMDITGIEWQSLLTGKTLTCSAAKVTGLRWLMECMPKRNRPDAIKGEKSDPFISSIQIAAVTVAAPDVTYRFQGPKGNFSCFMKGGSVSLNKWVYNTDEQKDTATFLYAHSGQVRLDSFIFLKPVGRYTVKKPLIDFETNANSVTLNKVVIKDLVRKDVVTGVTKEIYDLRFPSISLVNFNWNRLINHNTFAPQKVLAENPDIDLRFIRQPDAKASSKAGSFPHQLLLEAGLQTNIGTLVLNKGHIKYTEVTDKGDEGTIDFGNVHAQFSNITNMDSVIAVDKTCKVKLTGKFMNKSDVSASFDLFLNNKKGRFTMDGIIKNLDGEDVMKQTQAFSFIAVTSFHMSKMDMHLEGDETYAKGNFTMLYKDLKLSLFKFKSKYRKGRRGPLSFLGSTLVLFPNNPMPNHGVRSVTTSYARDTTKGFINLIWKNIFRGAKKTAVRDEALINLTDGPETEKGEQPKKGLLKRLFGKKSKK